MRCAVVAPTLPAPMTVTSGWDMKGWAPAPGTVRPVGRFGLSFYRCVSAYHPRMSRHSDPDWRPGTLAVHAGQEPDPATGAVAPPIYQTSTFAQEGVGRPTGGWEYARTGNPTRQRLEDAIALLEGGSHGLAFASGSATASAIAGLVRPGERVLISDDVYGGTYRLFERVLREMGVDAVWVDLSVDPVATLATRLTPDTRMVWLESPSNPLLKLVDIAAVAAAAHAHAGARGESPIVVVDNTFASPLSQQPLLLGADIVYHSATKYLSGHSDTINGVLATSRDDLFTRLKFLQNAIGAVPGPFDCFLVLRGLRTLELRIARHSSNGLRVAQALAARSDVAQLRYPGLHEGPHAHPQAALAQRQMRYAGGMISFQPAARTGSIRRGTGDPYLRVDDASSRSPSRWAAWSRCSRCPMA